MQRNSQSGNALLFVLTGIILFAALIYTMSRTGRTTQNMSFGKVSINAQSILSSAEKINNAVNSVTLQNNCRASKVSFETSELTGYVNAASPASKKCHVFDKKGGAGVYHIPSINSFDTSKSTEDSYGEYLFVSNVCLDNVGTGSYLNCSTDVKVNEEMLMILPWINKDTCVAINRLLKNPIMLTDPGNSFDASDAAKFTGSYTEGYTIGDVGVTTYDKGCFESTGSPGAGYHFYYTLIAR